MPRILGAVRTNLPQGAHMSDVAARVAAVVVAYNRADLLRESLEAIRDQSLPPVGIVVVDNASTDATGAVAASFAPLAQVTTLARNTGGAGGFAVGIAKAVSSLDVDYVWIMDDDSIPTPTALEELVQGVEGAGASLGASKVVWHDGRDHPMNTPRQRPFASNARKEKASDVSSVTVRSASFVSLLISTQAVREEGLPVVDYFIWNDDFEYSTRILRRRDGVYVPASVVIHKTAKFGSTDVDPGERFYYEVRNKLWMLRRSHSLGVGEKILYGGSTLLRWARTVNGSERRDVLKDAFARGWRDGWRTEPRANVDALADLGEDVTQAVLAVEPA